MTLVVGFEDGGTSPFGLALAAFGVVAGLLVAAVGLAAGGFPLPRPSGGGVVALAGLALWSLVALASISWSLAPADSWTDGIRVVCAAGALAGGMWFGALAKRPAQGACLAIALVAVTIAVYAVAQRAFSSEIVSPSFPRLREPVGYANALAALLGSAVPCSAVLGSHRAPYARAFGSSAIAALTVALALTGSRGGILAALIATAIMLAVGRRRLELVLVITCGVVPALPVAWYGVRLATFSAALPPASAGPGLLGALLGSMAVAALLGLVTQDAIGRVSDRARHLTMRSLELLAVTLVVLGVVAAVSHVHGPIALVHQSWDQLSGKGQVSNSTDSRLTSLSPNLRYRWWHEAWHAFTLRPIQGFGAGTFALVDQLSRPDATVAREAHSSALQVLSGTGIIGGVAALAALGGAIWACVGALRRLTGEERVAAAGLTAAFAGLALHAQIDWDWTFAVVTLVGYPIPGVLATAARGTVRPRALERVLSAGLIPLVIVLGIACALPYLSDRAVDRSETLAANGRYHSALVADNLAVRLDPLSTDALLDRAYVLQQLNRPQDAAADVRRALRLSPAASDSWVQASVLQKNVWHDPRGACVSARTALALAPHSRIAASVVLGDC